MTGILYALVPMLAWGSIGFISNKIGGTPNQQTFGLTLGAVVFASVVYMIVRPELTVMTWLYGIIGGMLWAVGQNGQFSAMQYMGVSVANPLSSGSQLVIGSLIGVLAFQEWTKPIQFILGTIALIFLLVGFYFSSKQDKDKSASQDSQPRDFKKGFQALTTSTLGYVSYTVFFNNIVNLDPMSAILPMSFGMVLGAAMFMKFQVNFEPVVLKNSIVGIMWGFGNIFMLLAAAEAGLAIAFSFSQLGAIISIIGGIVILGEKKTKKEMVWVLLGVSCFIIGAVLLGIVKSY
ncbi:GRP family sugar transporter [Streptococcus cuniculipharyngis]|uniref:Sugar transporter n=1 Tax=Streptococcus cuniculipharyngis TaxID=1562651 RepID=A0A5C5SD12_9STRE|nr:GRP family sugar transporter [Streptococcus cuniculipharyngis]TWS97689.1 sugar transporter [Streptococcus cuniculipharyngis]